MGIWNELFYTNFKMNDWILHCVDLDKNTSAKMVEIVHTFENALKEIEKEIQEKILSADKNL